jgi:predicted MFS family arabinose efflux permease
MTASLIPSPHLPAADTRRIDPAARWRVLAVFSLGFLVSYLYRGVNLGFGPHLSRELGLDASELGLLTSFYFLGFAFAQLPAGLLLDRLGPRRTEAGLLLVAVAGALVFAWAPGMFGLAAGRLLIGVGVSVCLGAAIQALSIWFPLRHMPLLNGVVMAIGGLGAVIVGLPLEWLLTRVEWRMVCVGLAGLTLAMAALLWFGVPDAARPKQESLADQLRGTRAVLGSERFWRVAPLTLLNQGVFLAVQNLWIGNFLRDVGGFTPQRSAGLVSLVGFAMMGGCVAAGWAARLVQRRGISLFAFAGGGMMAFIVVQAVILAEGLAWWGRCRRRWSGWPMA